MNRTRTRLAVTGAVVVTALAGVGALTLADRPETAERPVGVNEVRGQVVDEGGAPIVGARISTQEGEKVTTGAGGAFTARLDRPTLATVTAPSYSKRVQAIGPSSTPRIVLTGQPDTTLSVRFGGDVMMGRRYYEKQRDWPAVLNDPTSVAEHKAVLSSVAPLLGDADLSVVNLETPLIDDPYYNPNKPRPKKFHPSKALAYASAPATAGALKASGVDAVSLGNNHSFDALGPGLTSTMQALDKAGLKYFGAGVNEAKAWEPAMVTVKNQRVALLGCTTVAGEDEEVPYVAGPNRAGAALCTPEKVRQAVTAARKKAPYVALMLHGGSEYQRAQTPELRSLFKDATQAGAQMVIGGHPHVPGGLTSSGGSVVAESLGNFVFDQDLWETYPSFLLRVDLRAGAAVRTSTDPVLIDHDRPVPTVGAPAEAVARLTAGTVSGPARLGADSSQVTATPPGPAAVKERQLDDGRIQAVTPGWWFSGTSTPVRSVRAGSDLLYGTGTFERQGTDPKVMPGGLWSLGKYVRLTNESRCDDGDAKGDLGLELLRGPTNTEDLVATPISRVPVVSGQQLSLVADVRHAPKGAQLELHWYRGTTGGSIRTTREDIPVIDRQAANCRRISLNATVPKDARAVQVFLRLKPPEGTQETRRLAVDNVRLAEWAAEGLGGRQYDMVWSTEKSTARFVRDLPAVAGAPDDPVVRAADPK